MEPNTMMLGYLAVAILTYIGIIAITAALVFRLIRAIAKYRAQLLGPNLQASILGFIATIFLYNETIAKVLVSLSTLLVQSGKQIIALALGEAQNGTSEVKTYPEDKYNYMYEAYNLLVNFFAEFPWASLISLLFVWVLISNALNHYLCKEQPEGTGNSRLSFAFSEKARKNFFLGLLFVFSTFLFVSSIVAVPYLESDKAIGTIISNDSISEELKRMNTLDTVLPPMPATSILNLSPETLKSNYGGLATNNYRAIIMAITSEYDKQYQVALTQYKNDSTALATLKKEYIIKANKATDNVEDAFKQTSIKGRDKMVYRNVLLSWFSSKLEDYKREYRDIFASATDTDAYNYGLLKQHKVYADSVLLRIASDTAYEFSIANDGYKGTPITLYSSLSYNQELEEPVPPPNKAGDEWHLFGKIAGWLLDTNSFPLVLIVGMFGFGLFGSAISSIVKAEKTKKKDNGNEPYVQDLAGVVIRGMSAALVIFLAVLGGLSTINMNGENNPNPYVLFFICLVGAVYSENVWEWAKEKLAGTFGDGGDDKDGKPTDPKANKPTKPADDEDPEIGEAGEALQEGEVG